MSASTPLRQNMSTHTSPSKSPSRRVLGELQPRALNTTPSKQTNTNNPGSGPEVIEARALSPLKQVQTLSPNRSGMDKENVNLLAADAFKTSRKRSINEVEGVEQNLAHSGRTFAMPQAVPATTMSVEPKGNPYEVRDDRGSDTEPDSPLPEPVKEPVAEPVEEPITTSQVSNQSFSNFVDWKACASQPTSRPETAVQAQQQQSAATRAELLRLRLGFATYKVNTNQIQKSGSEILSTYEATSTTSTLVAGPSRSQNIPSITFSAPQQQQQRSVTHVKANLDPGRPLPKLRGGPVLLPTSYSSRMIHDYHLPSSPPDDNLPKCVSPEQVMSPVRADYRTPAARRISEEDYEDEEDEEDEENEEMSIQARVQARREKRFEMGDLTSSAIKENAAKGLMGLMSGRR